METFSDPESDRKLRRLLLGDDILAAVAHRLSTEDRSLTEAVAYVKRFAEKLSHDVPHDVEAQARILLHRANFRDASICVREKSNLGNMDAGRYMSDLKPLVRIHYLEEVEQELVAMFRDNPDSREVFDRLMRDFGVYRDEASQYLRLVADNVLPRSVAPFDALSSDDEPMDSQAFSRFHSSEHETIKLLLKIFLPADSSPLAWSARESAVGAAEGDGMKFLALLEIARRDHRDMLAGHTDELCAWQLSRWGLSPRR